MTDNDVTLLVIRMERNHALNDWDHFKDALQMMPQWRLTDPITVKYLINIDVPVVKFKVNYTTITPTVTNHALTEFPHT